jgi:hypothetical protein
MVETEYRLQLQVLLSLVVVVVVVQFIAVLHLELLAQVALVVVVGGLHREITLLFKPQLLGVQTLGAVAVETLQLVALLRVVQA